MVRLAVDATAIAPDAKGIGRVARGTAEALAARGIDVVALVRRGAEIGVPVELVRPRPAVLWEQTGLAAAGRRHDCVLTFTERLPLMSGGRFLIWLFELPTHRIAENRRGGGFYQRASDLLTAVLWRHSLRRAVKVLAGSQATADELRKAMPELDARVVYPGVDERFRPGTLAAGRHYFLHLGSSDPRDNTEAVISAFERARAAFSDPVRLVVAGGASGDRREGVEFVGHVSDRELIDLYRGATAFVDAVLYEGFGYGPLEAMACGAPVVASSVGAVREVVGDAALLCDPRSPSELAEALVRIVERPAEAQELRARGLERAQQFTWERTADALVAALELD
jgi:glycosyltransferase involved in cell wall biosynthesis